MKLKKLALSLLIAFIFLGSITSFQATVSANTSTNTSNAVAFIDVPSNHWAHNSIQSSVKNGIVQGYSDGTFRPNQYVSSIEFTILLIRAYAIEFQLSSRENDSWKDPFIRIAYDENWDIDFYYDHMTRGDVARLIYSVLEITHGSESESIQFMLDEKFSSGLTSATVSGYGADKKLTRAEAVTFIQNIKKKVPSISSYVSSTNKTYHEAKLRGIQLGDSLTTLYAKLGDPDRISTVGNRNIYSYNNDYSKYALYIVHKNRIVGMYSNAQNVWSSKSLANINTTMKDTNDRYSPIHISYYIDELSKNTVEGIFIAVNYHYLPSNATTRAEEIEFAMQNFDMTNAFRVKNDLTPFIWHEVLANTAFKHSKDMNENNYFEHTNLNGKSPFDRMKMDGIKYRAAAENIAYGYRNAMDVTNGWINSAGHRRNMLSDIEYLGVGVYKNYYTQNFFTAS